MDESSLKTSTKQRIIIGCIAALMLFSTVAVYALIILGNKDNDSAAEASAKLEEYQAQLSALEEKLIAREKEISDKYYEDFSQYRSRVRSYNANSANNGGIVTEDLKVGDGDEISADNPYSVFYIGWCADESVFDSSFDSWDEPTQVAPLTHTSTSSFIAGWEEGVEGMKIGGVRELTIPGELAYGDTQEICGGTNSPLKYVVYMLPTDEEYQKYVSDYNDLYYSYIELYYSVNSSSSYDDSYYYEDTSEGEAEVTDTTEE